MLIVNTRSRKGEELFRCTITPGTEISVIDTRQVVIMANGSFYGTHTFSSDAPIGTRILSIFMMDSLSRWRGLKVWIGSFLGHHLTFPESR